jgi:hypothetical protein
MLSLLILAALLILAWLWATWKRDTAARFMQGWSYALLVVAGMCLVMALGVWLR